MFKIFLTFVIAMVVGVAYLVVKHKKKNPEKSYVIALLNTLFIPMRALNVGPFSMGKITLEKSMEVAMKETGLKDFGDLSFVDSYKKISTLPFFKRLHFTNLGYVMAASEFQMNLRRRLMMVNYLKKHPEILNIPIKQPLFIFGLGRSGTTFVHRLLSLDPKVRSPALWELVIPTPTTENHADPNDIVPYNKEIFEKDREKRLQRIRERLAQRNVMGDSGFEEFHEIGADLPEEDLFGLSDEIPTIFHYLFPALCSWEVFFKDITPQEVIRSFVWYKKVLQTLLFQTNEIHGEKRWVLKCPLHIFYIKELAKVFPDAKLVWAHRHPCPTVTSQCALLRAMHHNYYEKESCDNKELGRIFKKASGSQLLAVDGDIKVSGLQCADVLFENLTSKPIEVVKEVYKQFNWEFTPEYQRILEDYLEKNRKQREETRAKLAKKDLKSSDKLHSYKPEDFGLTKQELCEGPFLEYVKKYNITSDK